MTVHKRAGRGGGGGWDYRRNFTATIKYFGNYLTYDYCDEFIQMNYKQRLKKLENTANWWKGRGLTLYGRAQIINSLLLPKLIFKASMFVVPEEII